MSETGFAALDAAIDNQTADTSVLSETNIVEDMVEVANGTVIGNGPQAVLGALALCTGYMYGQERQVNTVLTGPSATGKSAIQQATKAILPSEHTYEITDASSKGVLDDGRWDDALMAPLDEWQKVPDELTELLKSLSGGADEEYRYARNVPAEGSGRTTEEIVKKAKPYQFLYAQHMMDHELSTRLVFLPVDNNVHIRDAIIEKEGQASHVSVDGYEKEFIYDTHDRERALREHLRGIETDMEEVPGGEENHRGMVDGYLPPWVRKSVKPIFDVHRTETNRVAGQVFNLIRASAVVNYHARPMLDTVRDYLEDSSSLSVPRKEKLRDLLRELEDQFYVSIHERAGPNGAHLYEFQSLRDIQMPRLSNLRQYMDTGEIEECRDLSPDVDLDAPFDGTTDPFAGQPFIDTVSEMADEFASNPVERAAATADAVADVSADGDTDTQSQSTLAADAMAGNEVAMPSGPVEQAVHERLLTHADDTVWSIETVGDLHLLGVLDGDETIATAETTDTLVDPDHQLWDQPTRPDDWITTEGEAHAELEQAVEELGNKGVLDFDVDSEPDGFVATHVADPHDDG